MINQFRLATEGKPPEPRRTAPWPLVLVLAAVSAQAAESDWPSYQRDAAHSGAAERLRPPLTPLWTFNLPTQGWGFASAVAADQAIYVGTVGGDLLALSEEGVELWRYRAGGAVHMAAAVSSGTVVFGSAEGEIIALDARTGARRWGYRVGSNVHSSPNVVDGVVYIGANDGAVYALGLEDGRLLWRHELGGYIWASPAVDDRAVYAAALDGRVAALSRLDGHALWETSLPAQVRASPSLSGDAVILGADDGRLRALRISDGGALWTFDAGAPIVGGTSLSSSAVYAASLKGKLWALEASGGAPLWSFDAGVEIDAAPTVHGGVVAIGAVDHGLYLVGASSGALISRIELGGRVAAPAVSARGRLYAVSDDGVLASFDSSNAAPTVPTALAGDGASFSWTFNDPDHDDRQTAFQLQLATAPGAFLAGFDTGVIHSSVPAFALAQVVEEGSHYWRVRTFDLFSASSPFTGGQDSFLIDRSAPFIVVSSPRTDDRFVVNVDSISVAFQVTDVFDPAPVYEAALVQLEDRGSPRGSRPDRVPVSSSAFFEPSFVDDGLWRLEVSARDAAGNSTSTFSGPFEVIHDVRPPRTALAVGTPRVEIDGVTAVTRATFLGLFSIDDVASEGDGLGLGVALQSVSVDGVLRSTFSNASPAPGQAFSSSFTLTDPDGLHILVYHARDTLGNVETVHVTTIAVDNTPPQTALTITGGGEYAAPASFDRYVSSDALFSLLAVDPVIDGSGVGVAATRLKDNGGVFSTVSGTFTLVEGLHNLIFESVDRLGNLETAKSTTVAVDASSPHTSLSVLAGRQFPGPGDASFYASSDTRIVLAAEDPVVNAVASGAALIEFQTDKIGRAHV